MVCSRPQDVWQRVERTLGIRFLRRGRPRHAGLLLFANVCGPAHEDQEEHEPHAPKRVEHQQTADLKSDDQHGQQGHDACHHEVQWPPPADVDQRSAGVFLVAFGRRPLAAGAPQRRRVRGQGHRCGGQHEADKVAVQVVEREDAERLDQNIAEAICHNRHAKANLGCECIWERSGDPHEKHCEDREGEHSVHLLQELEDGAHVDELRRDDEREQRQRDAEDRGDKHHPLVGGLGVDEYLVDVQAEDGGCRVQRRVVCGQHTANQYGREEAERPIWHDHLDDRRVDLISIVHLQHAVPFHVDADDSGQAQEGEADDLHRGRE
mmetsp:Transcript_145528/g.362850  ORF Transcript_145528/g.362850 Transcript_145528/m.362850 type:complete len:322 (+) Transcript_145528:155-1120(+)